MKFSKKNILVLLVIAGIGIIIYNSLSQPGIRQLNTNFKEISFVRNEQNAGPVLRSYIVVVDQINLKELEIYGNFMPHTKYGNTKVFFFDAGKPFPSKINLSAPFFPKQFEANCLMLYEKDGMGKVHLTQNPFGVNFLESPASQVKVFFFCHKCFFFLFFVGVA
jgi:hypothetical protein